MQEVENILRILKGVRQFVVKGDGIEIKALSDQTIHSATVSQDSDNIIVAVLVYSIGKIFEREHYRRMEGWSEFYDSLLKELDNAIKFLEKGNIDSCRVALGEIRNSLNKIDGDLGDYMKDVFRKAEINKAFKLYEHGLSSEKVAELLGVSLWDLSSYIGQSHIGDAKVSVTMPVRERVKIAEEFFG